MSDAVFKNVTRETTEAERAKIKAIELDAAELDAFMERMRQAMIEAASAHQHAVQNNFALRVETSIKLSRPVLDSATDLVRDLEGKACVEGKITGTKKY